MTYSELLNSNEWKVKRVEILKRDEYSCQQCCNLNIVSKSRNGVIHYITEEYTSSVSIIEFNRSDYLVLKISKKEFSLLKKEIVVLFEDDGGWCRVIGIRSLSKKEKDEYIKQINHRINSFLSAAIVFNLPLINERGEVVNLDELKMKPLIEIIGDEKPKWNIIKGLHVHHKYYKTGCLPWNYNNDALTTLCWNCHEELHKYLKVPVFDEKGNQTALLNPCTRCFGAGWFPEYNHVQSGVCFRCQGAKYEEFI